MTDGIDTDFRSQKNVPGGSKSGTVKRKCPFILKEFARQWAIDHIAGGNESAFIHNPSFEGGRWNPSDYFGLVPVLYRVLPEESKKYFDNRPLSKDALKQKDPHLWHRAHLIGQRVHKMYYWNDGTSSGRGKSSEHSHSSTRKDKEKEQVLRGALIYGEWARRIA